MRATSGPSQRAVCGADIVAALRVDPAAAAALATLLESLLVTNSQFAQRVVAAVEAVQAQGRISAPGRLLAGTVSTGAGSILAPTGGAPAKAFVFLSGAAAAVACTVPAHLYPDLTAGAEVWVQPVNGSLRDLLLVAIRAYTGLHTAQALTPISAVPTLAAGNQQSGVYAVGAVATAAGQSAVAAVTFPLVCANTPSSVTLSQVTGSNSTTLVADNISPRGFRAVVNSVAAGVYNSFGTYTTVGN